MANLFKNSACHSGAQIVYSCALFGSNRALFLFKFDAIFLKWKILHNTRISSFFWLMSGSGKMGAGWDEQQCLLGKRNSALSLPRPSALTGVDVCVSYFWCKAELLPTGESPDIEQRKHCAGLWRGGPGEGWGGFRYLNTGRTLCVCVYHLKLPCFSLLWKQWK